MSESGLSLPEPPFDLLVEFWSGEYSQMQRLHYSTKTYEEEE